MKNPRAEEANQRAGSDASVGRPLRHSRGRRESINRPSTIGAHATGRRGTEMPDNIPPWSGSDAMDRLRVAIENHQKATERQTGTTRWLTWVMTALTILMAVPTVVQIWRAYSEIWPVVRFWRPW
jgi:hypothetical protein